MSDAIIQVPRKFVWDVFDWADEVAARLVAEGQIPKGNALLLLTTLREDMRTHDEIFAEQLIPTRTEAVGFTP